MIVKTIWRRGFDGRVAGEPPGTTPLPAASFRVIVHGTVVERFADCRTGMRA